MIFFFIITVLNVCFFFFTDIAAKQGIVASFLQQMWPLGTNDSIIWRQSRASETALRWEQHFVKERERRFPVALLFKFFRREDTYL